MRALSLFSGIGGIDLACEWSGIETVAMCEREPFCQKVLKKHWPTIPIYDDVCTLTKERLEQDGIGTIDIIHGGYPCQPFSLAGNREGAEDDRHLWPEYFRLVKELRPRWVVGENVAGHISLGLDIVLSNLESEGYSTRAFIIPAAAVNAPHRRDRVFIIANSMRGIRSSQQEGEHKKMGRTQNPLDDGEEQFVARILANADSEWELQSQRLIEEFRRWTSDSGKDVANAESLHAQGFNNGSWKEQPGRGSWWASEPDVGRVANGIPQRVDRLKALGNAVVPQQIYPILAAIKQIDDMLKGESA